MPGRQRAAGTVRVCGQSEEVACRSDLRGVGSRHRTGELENQGSRATSPASPRRGDLTVATCSIMALRRSSKPSMAYGARSRRPAPGAAEASVPRYAPGAEPDWELESGWSLQQTPIGNSAMGAGDHRAAEAGLHTPRTRPAPKDNRQSVTSLFLSSPLMPPSRQNGTIGSLITPEPEKGKRDMAVSPETFPCYCPWEVALFNFAGAKS